MRSSKSYLVTILSEWQYIVLKPTQKYLERMQLEDQVRIVEALDNLLSIPDSLDIKQLKGRSEKRLRVGKYRVLFVPDTETQTYIVTNIGSPGDIYK
jgi:mRNA interferase RelE/StbE